MYENYFFSKKKLGFCNISDGLTCVLNQKPVNNKFICPVFSHTFGLLLSYLGSWIYEERTIKNVQCTMDKVCKSTGMFVQKVLSSGFASIQVQYSTVEEYK